MKKNIFITVILSICLLSGCGLKSAPGSNISNVKYEELSAFDQYCLPQNNEYWYRTDGKLIYSISKSNQSKKVLYQAEDENFIDDVITATDEKIYFNIFETENRNQDNYYTASFNFCSVDKNGGDFTVLLTKPSAFFKGYETIADIKVYNDLYVIIKTNGRSTYLHKIDTSETKPIDDRVGSCEIHNQKIYYQQDGSIYVIDLDMKNKKVLVKGNFDGSHSEKNNNMVDTFVFVNDKIFFYQYNPEGIYQYNNGKKKLIKTSSFIIDEFICSFEGKLYFAEVKDNTGKIISYDPDDKTFNEILTINNFVSGVWNIKDGYFYYYYDSESFKQIKI